MKVFKLTLITILISVFAHVNAQNWNTPDIEFTYTSPDTTGDSVVIWKLKYDSLENTRVTTSKSPYLGNYVSSFHMPLSDAIMQPVEGTCDEFSFAFSSNSSGYSYYVFDMDNPENSYTMCDGQKELVIACMCRLGSGCCVPQAQPAGVGLNVTCNVEEDCLKCDKPFAYYIDAGTGKKKDIAWNGATLVVKAKSMNYSNN